jgi:hypothetical protein
MGSSKPGFGYTLPQRLAFLRQDHVDPVDLEPEGYFGNVTADMSLPEFDDYSVQADAGEHWNGYRYALGLAFMRKLFDAAQASGQRDVWVAQRRESYDGNWYGLWARPDAPLPEIPEDALFNYNPGRNFAALAHAQSPQAVTVVSVWGGEDAGALAQYLKALKPGWDGVVLNCEGDPRGDYLKSFATSAAMKPSPR